VLRRCRAIDISPEVFDNERCAISAGTLVLMTVLMVVYLTLKFFRDGSIFPPHPAVFNQT
jgi:hypothetical protein